MDGLFWRTLGLAGGTSVVLEVSAVDFRGGAGVGDEVVRISVDEVFRPQRRGVVGTGSAADRRSRCNSLEVSEEGAFPASAGAG